MFLDVDVTLACHDLEFLHSVWKSSRIVPVGLFPRLHWKSPQLKAQALGKNYESFNFNYGGWVHVWWHQKYSLLLSKVIMVDKDGFKVRSMSLA